MTDTKLQAMRLSARTTTTKISAARMIQLPETLRSINHFLNAMIMVYAVTSIQDEMQLFFFSPPSASDSSSSLFS